MAFPEADWRLTAARIDYWSGTTDDHKLGEWAYERARDYIEGDLRGDWSRSGTNIQGYIGVASEHAFAGIGERGCFVRFSSLGASDRWSEFAAAGLRCTRMDTLVDCVANRDVRDVAYSIRYGERLPSRQRGQPIKRILYSDEATGDTVYIGSTSSIRRGRIYDKARESPGSYPLGTWRYEIQSRHAAGEIVSSALAGRESVAEWIAVANRNWFLDRGINAPWNAPGGARLPSVRVEVSNDAKRLKWLRRSVAPMVERMKSTYSTHDLRSALGLLYDPKSGGRQ